MRSQSSTERALTRPTLGANESATQDATEAVARLVAELQAGWDQHDAETSNRHFAANVLWGSPFGATVHGYEELHAIHVRLKEEKMGGSRARFEIVNVEVPIANVAVAHVRRVALDDAGKPIQSTSERDGASGPFSEMALYILVKRDDDWWLAAGQNTPIRRKQD